MPKLKLQYFGHLMRSRLVGKDPNAGKDWWEEEKGATEDEMVGWHHQLNGHEFEQTGRWWRTGKPGVLQSMWSQRVRHEWATKQQFLEIRKDKSHVLGPLNCLCIFLCLQIVSDWKSSAITLMTLNKSRELVTHILHRCQVGLFLSSVPLSSSHH